MLDITSSLGYSGEYSNRTSNINTLKQTDKREPQPIAEPSTFMARARKIWMQVSVLFEASKLKSLSTYSSFFLSAKLVEHFFETGS
jgi:hypothetical protein